MNRRLALYLSVLSLSAALFALGQLAGAPAPTSSEAPSPPPSSSSEDPVKGLWSRWPDRQGSGDPVRFYYFHGDGHGLYRYGRIGFTNTHSFDYRVAGDEIALKFRKTGKQHRFAYSVELGRDGRRVLHVKTDPEERDTPVDYYFVPPPALGEHALHAPDASSAGTPAGRMWIDVVEHATGGMQFSLWQLTPAGIDGRGTGWHHRGDFDDWSTEAMSYRLHNQRIQLRFELTGEEHETPFGIAASDDGKRRLFLESDPRNWWHEASFVDMGRSFAFEGAPADLLAPHAAIGAAPESD